MPGGLFEPPSIAVMYKGKAYSVPQSVSPWPLVTRMDILEAAKVDPPKTWDELIEVCKKLQKPPKLTGFGMCLGLHTDTDNNVMNMIWSYGGKLVEADDKTVALQLAGHGAGGEVDRGYVQQAQDHPQRGDLLGQSGQ